MTDLDATWRYLERVGRATGHVVARCPRCRARVMVSILNGSGTSRWVKSGGGWPKCRQCRAGVRVEPEGDLALVARVRPGWGPGKRQAAVVETRWREALALTSPGRSLPWRRQPWTSRQRPPGSPESA